jgi:hypothetical protein
VIEGGAQLGGEELWLFPRGEVAALVDLVVGGIIEQSNEAQYPVGHAVQLAFTDNGDPGVGKDTQVTYPGIDSASPWSVPLFDYQPELALIDGNYAVHDAQP